MRSEREVSRAIERYSDTVRRICFLHLKNYADTEDIFQTVFLKYALYSGTFESAEHEKAWLIRVTVNAFHDLLKSFARRNTVSMELLTEEAAAGNPENGEVLQAVLSLPKKYKDVIYLHYYEGYSAVEIAKMLGKNENTVYSLLSRARGLLKDMLGGEEL